MNSNQEHDKFGPSQIRQNFAALFTPYSQKRLFKGGISQPYFYSTEHAIIFPPVSDNPKESGLDSIEDVILHASPILYALPQALEKTWLFVVAQERVLNKLTKSKREHWVVLHYDPKNGAATVLDPAYPLFAQYYDNSFIFEDLKNTFQTLVSLTLSVKSCNTVFLREQSLVDYVHCGYWAVININSFAVGTSIEKQQQEVNSLTKKDCNILFELCKKNLCVNAESKAVQSSDDENWVEEFELPPEDEMFNEEIVSILEQKFRCYFREICAQPDLMLKAILSRKFIGHDGIKLDESTNKGILTVDNLDAALATIEEKFKGVANTEIKNHEHSEQGFYISDADRAISYLLPANFNAQEFQSFTLSWLLKYEATVFESLTKLELYVLCVLCNHIGPEIKDKTQQHLDSRINQVIHDEVKLHHANLETHSGIKMFKSNPTKQPEEQLSQKLFACTIS
jgi:hypothetical protein